MTRTKLQYITINYTEMLPVTKCWKWRDKLLVYICSHRRHNWAVYVTFHSPSLYWVVYCVRWYTVSGALLRCVFTWNTELLWK